MKQIDFPASFLTGHAVIDDDHRRLISLLNKINDCFREDKGEEANEICEELQTFMAGHHAREEEILKETNFPRLGLHEVSHQELMNRCRQITTECKKACLQNRGGDCTTLLSSSILEHIVSKDLDFKSHLQVEGVAERFE